MKQAQGVDAKHCNHKGAIVSVAVGVFMKQGVADQPPAHIPTEEFGLCKLRIDNPNNMGKGDAKINELPTISSR